jgi:hypothetical protein
MRIVLIGFLCVKSLLGQSQTNTVSGSCDQVINDNRGVITITCSGVDKSLMEQLKKTADVLNRIARRQTDPAVLGGLKGLNIKMDEVLSDTRELKETAVQNNRQLAAHQQELAATKRYAYLATLTFNGTPYVKGDITFSNDISQATEGTWFETGEGTSRPVCTAAALQKNRNAIRLFPDFPFTFYALAYCLQRKADPEWRSYAEKAATIFEQTTTIGGHISMHDESLAYLRQILQQSK